MIKRVSTAMDDRLNRVFRKCSPVLRSSRFADPKRQAVILLTGILTLAILGVAFIYPITSQSSTGFERSYQFSAEDDRITVRELPGIRNLDELSVSISINRSAALEVFVCHESAYEEWEYGPEDGDEKATDLDTVFYRNSTFMERTINETVNGDGQFYLVVVNRDGDAVDVTIDVETTHPARVYCTSICIMFTVLAALLAVTAMKIALNRDNPIELPVQHTEKQQRNDRNSGM